jgi:isopentenyl-diphosphate delta-isomerase
LEQTTNLATPDYLLLIKRSPGNKLQICIYFCSSMQPVMIKEEVILVDEQDSVTGTMEKLEAHEKGCLHRAFSVFIFNDKHEMLLQQRAMSKYHSAGLWTNACCSHPRPGEETQAAAHRRLKEEMGLETDLTYSGNFIYKAAFDNGLTEHEFDHVFTGKTDRQPVLNKAEAEDYAWQTVAQIKEQVVLHPEKFTAWFKIALYKWF